MMPALLETAGEAQFGGIPGRGTTHASMILRLAMSVAEHRQQSCGALFMDVVQAFYRTLRELLVCSDLDDVAVACVVRAAGLPPSAMHELAKRMQERSTILEQQVEQGNMDAHVMAQTAQCYQTPWFMCEGSDQLSLPQRSVFPGQPLADVLYEVLMADCMNEVRQVLDAEGLALHLPVDEHNRVQSIFSDDAPMQTAPLSDVEFADDGTIMIIMPAEGLYDAMCRALVLVSDVFASRGHLLNIGPAKTAALMCLRGKGAKSAKRDIWHGHGGMLGGNSALLGHVTAPVVRNYVHLGSVIDATGAMMSEIRYRASSTTDTLRVLRTKVFGPSDMSDSTRMMFADSLVMSGRLYNAGAWSDLTLGENKHADGEVMKVYRAAARVRFEEADSCV